MRYLEPIKKILVLTFAALSVSIVSVTNSNADAPPSTGDYLQQIAQNTYGTLQALQNLPKYVDYYAQMAKSWMTPDDGDSSFISTTQQNFATLGNIFATSSQSRTANGLQQQIIADIIGASTTEFVGRTPSILKNVPNINDLAYGTLIGAPPIQGQQPNPYAYIRYASVLNYPHNYPQKTWPDGENKQKYKKYFETISAIQSFNTYVISQLGNNSTATPIQNQLTSQASKSEWLASIATEELGRVLRQILLFESQNYVLNTQIQQNQMQLVATQAMTNSLLILFNQQQEEVLYKNAQGLSPM